MAQLLWLYGLKFVDLVRFGFQGVDENFLFGVWDIRRRKIQNQINNMLGNIFKDFHKVLFHSRIYSSNWRSGIISH